MKFQYYPANVKITKSLGELTLEQFIESVRNPKDKIKKCFLEIQAAAENGDEELKVKLKTENLYYFTPSVYTDGEGRSYSNIIDFTGLMVVEFDKVDFAEELKHYIFNDIKSVICAFMSPSKKGCKFIIKIPKCKDVEEYKEYYSGISYYLDKISGYDVANYNPILPLFMSWDEDILYRTDAETWTRKGYKIGGFDYKAPVSSKPLPENTIKQSDIDRVHRRIKNMFDRIIDNGHPQVRSIALSMGGWVAQGYLTELEAQSLGEQYINFNGYLSKKASIYKKTLSTFIREGMKSPLAI